MDLRFEQVTLSRPQEIVGDYPPNVQMNCIYVVEQPQSVPKGESAIEWRLLTTHQIDSPDRAMQCVEWYRARWYIEELFRTLKSEGLKIESSQLATGLALKKLVLFSMQAALQIMILKIA